MHLVMYGIFTSLLKSMYLLIMYFLQFSLLLNHCSSIVSYYFHGVAHLSMSFSPAALQTEGVGDGVLFWRKSAQFARGARKCLWPARN